ncbi:DNA internalization-related competence protein ComEC/Rec2 [Rubripirellula lacrimiformis]|uniref:DNA internalization-related competence protein ComEC/Rec2 n=1 Tax=Rubripirellula lacrimiformis TaxID=1930273 RepID=UPI0011A84F05|nr:DNA internalization-related competence protein ComEC/Rec2 [Rubripirellula lacrimiformis]
MSIFQSLSLLSDQAGSRLRQSTHQQPLLLVAIATVAGILIDSSLCQPGVSVSPTVRFWIWMIAIAAGLLITALGSNFQTSRGPRYGTAISAVMLMLPVGALDHLWQQDSYQASPIANRLDDQAVPTIVEGVVDRPAVLRRHPMAQRRIRQSQSEWQTQLEVDIDQMRVGRDNVPMLGRLLVSVGGRCDHLRPGDRVRVYGKIRGVGPATNPGETDQSDFYERRGLHGRVEVDRTDQIQVIGPTAHGYAFSRWIAGIANRGRDGLLDRLGPQTGPLAVALVIGQRDFVDNATRDQLLVTGTAHLLSVSGMHLAIVVMMTTWIAMLLRLPMPMKIVVILVVCVFYCAITGARPPVMRAAVLVSTLMFGIWMRRPGQAINTLSLAAIALVLWNPLNVFSVGVQLSFMAVATLVLCSGHGRTGSAAVDEAIRQEEQLTRLAESARSRPMVTLRYLQSIVAQLLWFSACVSIVSLPLVWHQFHVVSLISVPTNVILGPILMIALASGIATAAATMIFPAIAAVPAIVCDRSLALMGWIIGTASRLPLGHAWLPAPPTTWVIVFYVVLAATLLLPSGIHARRLRYGWIAVWCAIALGVATKPKPMPTQSIEATFIDVGHGTSVVIRQREQDGTVAVWLYDCGWLGNEVGSSRDIDLSLWSLGVTRLNGVFLSHADADHFNALPGVLRRFRVDRIWTPPGMLEEPEPALVPIREAVAHSNVPVIEMDDRHTIVHRGIRIQVLHPPPVRIDGSDNANSLVIQIDRGGQSLLLPGDLEPPGTGALVRKRRPSPGGVLMAPHHGSLQMDAGVVLQWARPSEVVVSGGQRAGRPEVATMLSQYGAAVHVTRTDGAIRVRIDQDGKIEVRSWLAQPW